LAADYPVIGGFQQFTLSIPAVTSRKPYEDKEKKN